MTGGEVAEVLGSPNVVSTDEQGREVWIYDRISTDTAYSQGGGFGSILIFGVSAQAAQRHEPADAYRNIKFDDIAGARFCLSTIELLISNG